MRTYGLWNLAFAALYVWAGFFFAPGRSLAFNLALAGVSGLLALAGVGLVAGARWGRRLGIAASTVLLVFAAITTVGMVASAAYLHGVFGPLGRGMAVVTLCIAGLFIEAFAILPLFELRFLLRSRE